MKRAAVHICAAKKCFNTEMTHPFKAFFNLPQDIDLQKQWLENSGSLYSIQRGCPFKLCGDHFEDHYFSDEGRTLLDYSLGPVPTIFDNHQRISLPSEPAGSTASIDLPLPTRLDVDPASMYQCLLDPTELLVQSERVPVSYHSVEMPKMKHFDTDMISRVLLTLGADTELYSLDKLCRMCMHVTQHNFVQLFSESVEAREIQRLCRVVMPKTLEVCDRLPQRVCQLCISDLKTCHRIMDKFQNADKYLRTIAKYSLFTVDECYKSDSEEDEELTEEYFLSAIPKNAMAVPLDVFNLSDRLPSDTLRTQENAFPAQSEDNGLSTSCLDREQSPSVRVITDGLDLTKDDLELVCTSVVVHPRSGNDVETSAVDPEGRSEVLKKSQINEHLNISRNLTQNGSHVKNGAEVETTKYFASDFSSETVCAVNDSKDTSITTVSYKCLLCSEVLTSYSTLVTHVSIHRKPKTLPVPSCDQHPTESTEEKLLDNQRPQPRENITCIQCRGKEELYFKNKKDLFDHFKKHHFLKCVHCHRHFMSEQKLKKHIRTKHDTKCNICEKIFKSVNSRKTHEVYYHRRHKEVCWVCGMVLKSKPSLNNHMRIHEEKSYKCEVCKKLFSSASSLHAHKSTHVLINGEREKNFLCEFCPKKFHKLHLLKTHTVVHEETKPYHCVVCGKGFSCEANLKKHEKTRTLKGICPNRLARKGMNLSKRARPLLECNICGRKFIRPVNAKRHRKYHFCDGDPEIVQKLLNEPEEHRCSFCNKVTLSKVAYMYHTAEHTGSKRPLCCEFCGKTSSHYNQYLIHERTHTGERPFKCSYCDTRFYDKNDLRNHEAGHSDHKPYVCEVCQKTFKLRVNLLQHTITHKGSSSFRPYSCPKCNRGYITKGHLQKHTRSDCLAVKADNFPCPDCGRVFSNKMYMKNHMAKVHKDKGEKTTVQKEVEKDEEPFTPTEFLSIPENYKEINDLQGLSNIISPFEYIVGES